MCQMLLPDYLNTSTLFLLIITIVVIVAILVILEAALQKESE